MDNLDDFFSRLEGDDIRMLVAQEEDLRDAVNAEEEENEIRLKIWKEENGPWITRFYNRTVLPFLLSTASHCTFSSACFSYLAHTTPSDCRY